MGSCGALCLRPPAAHHPDDRAFVVGGRVAGQILRAYSAYFHNLNPKLDNVVGNEEFLVTLADVLGIHWQFVRKDWFPFFAALHMKQPVWKEPLLCLRGARRVHLEKPTDACIHPSLVRVPFCEDYPLA